MVRARVAGQVNCSGGEFIVNEGTALNCAALECDDLVFSKHEHGQIFQAKGLVTIRGARIAGSLTCAFGRFDNPTNVALNAESATIGRDAILTNGFHARGGVVFRGANIGDYLDCSGGTLENPRGVALAADALKAGHGLMLRSLQGVPFTALGEVQLDGAEIGGLLDCDGGQFVGGKEFAIRAQTLRVSADVNLRDGFSATGEVRFIGAEIGGDVICRGASFVNPDGTALCLDSCRVGLGLHLVDVKEIRGSLDLEQAQTRTLHDDGSAWPALIEGRRSGRITLDGFTYERFSGSAVGWEFRRSWLRCQPEAHLAAEFRPQPWAQLIEVLRKMGHENDAKRIAIEREKLIARSPATVWHRRIGNRLLGLTTGYGYRPGITLIWSAGFVLLWMQVFAQSDFLNYMAPRDGHVLIEMEHTGLPPAYPRFNAFWYALDVYLPLIELGQDQAWAPANSKVCPETRERPCRYGEPYEEEWMRAGVHRAFYWILNLLGWVFVSLFIAGMSGVMKRE